jgi:nitrogen fixation NifU-like protein
MDAEREERLPEYPKEVIELINDEKYIGRMNDPTSSSYVQGPCGDSMEFYLVIKEEKIIGIRYYTEGCGATRACAAMAAQLAEGKTIKEALAISAGDIIDRLQGLPADHLHCSILAVSTLYRAIADYLLKP